MMIEIAPVGADDNTGGNTGSMLGSAFAANASVMHDSQLIQQRLFNASEEEKENLYMALNSKYEITDVLPPPNHDDVQVLVMAVGYMLLFLLGTCGNVAVLTTIYQVVRSRRTSLDNTLIYVIVLSCVDFGVCLSLPFTVIDQILGFWMFGSIVCKLHAVLENFGKILSALILTAMSFDRFAGVCHPHKKWLRSTSLAVCILVGMAVYALATLCPLLWSFTARELVLFEKETAPHKITRMRIEKCTMVNISSTVFTMFTVFLFVLCYLVPLFLVAFFYSRLLNKLRQHARQFTSSQIPLMRISLYTLAVACFYFICWTPFWVATAFAVYLEYAGEQGGTVPPVFVYCMYFIHALPFTNSAVNWILYGALNSQLQHRYRGSRNNENTTLVANGHSTANTLKTIPSINGISPHKTTSESARNQPTFDFQLPTPQPYTGRSTYSEPACVQLSTLNGQQLQLQQYQSTTQRWHFGSNQSTNTTTTPAMLTPTSRRPSFPFPVSVSNGMPISPLAVHKNEDVGTQTTDRLCDEVTEIYVKQKLNESIEKSRIQNDWFDQDQSSPENNHPSDPILGLDSETVEPSFPDVSLCSKDMPNFTTRAFHLPETIGDDREERRPFIKSHTAKRQSTAGTASNTTRTITELVERRGSIDLLLKSEHEPTFL
ncbi:7 transmembrane receptor (rhodopsin family) domain-containing protein [Ditylenchus destructor]|uniref:7 transmembrane receptor (Rhodopsin family) domain-containing protein n=1 Tax=Ditylenchus destructor TaxID=166010 RepID=A0AAD4NG76_9BILA|nr:7 transmembrane receptor (rhodopsin family) domain-containing protein [Ditylenchus destructor]